MLFDFKILQISDLHFVADLTKEGRAFYKRPFQGLKAKEHDFVKASALANFVHEQGPFDLVLVTGDLATDGSRGALATVRGFLDRADITGGIPERSISRGINTNCNNRLLLPGNHDRYTRPWIGFQSSSHAFEDVLETPKKYPYVVGFREPSKANDRSEPALLFFVYDSTPSIFAKLWIWQKSAVGRVEARECEMLDDMVEEISRDGSVRSLDGSLLHVDYEKCVRIVVLHHHPTVKSPFFAMQNADLFLEHCCRAGINLILFGHHHQQFWDTRFGVSDRLGTKNHKMTMFCCPSTTEYSASNGFFVFDINSSHCRHSLYKWDDDERKFTIGALLEDNTYRPRTRVTIPFLARP